MFSCWWQDQKGPLETGANAPLAAGTATQPQC